MPLAKVRAKRRRGQNPKWLPVAILEIMIPKSVILRRFCSKITTKVSILTNFMVKNLSRGYLFDLLFVTTWGLNDVVLSYRILHRQVQRTSQDW